MLNAVSATNEASNDGRTPRHWPLIALTFVLLFAAVSVVGASALPAVARELGWTHARTVSRETHRQRAAGRAGIDAVREREQKLSALDDDDEEEPPYAADHPRIAIVAQATPMFRGASAKSGMVGSIDAGEKILVMREDHGFFLVMRQGRDEGDLGWVKKSDVLIR
jgi:hypothetical protein